MFYDRNEVINVYLSKLAKFVMDNSRLTKELVSLDSEFPLWDTDEQERKIIIFDWFIYDYKLKGIDKTPLEYFIELSKDLPREEKKIYEAFKQNIYSLFEVKAVKIGKEMILKDLATEKEYWVWERTSTQNLLKGQCLFTRVLPYQNHYILSGMVNVFPLEATYMIRLGYKRMREKKIDTKISPKQVAEVFSGFEKRERPQELDLDKLEDRMKEKLEEAGLSGTVFLDIMDKINHEIEPGYIFKDICERAVFPNEKDAEELMELLVVLWNKVPHKNLGGVSPEEKSKILPRGPQEAALIDQLIVHIQDVVNPETYSTQEELDKAIIERQERWLDTKDPELDGRSPREVILEERQRLGRLDKDINIRITAYPVNRKLKEEERAKELFDAAIKLTKGKNYKEAIEKYRQHLQIVPENYVAWGNMGILYGFLLDKKEAFKCLHKALSINPDYKTAKDNLRLLERANKEDLKRLSKNGMIKWLT